MATVVATSNVSMCGGQRVFHAGHFCFIGGGPESKRIKSAFVLAKLNPDGSQVVTWTADATLHLWSTSPGSPGMPV